MKKDIKDAFLIDLKDKKSPPRVSKLNALLIQKMNTQKKKLWTLLMG